MTGLRVTTLEQFVAQGRQAADQQLWMQLAAQLALVDTWLLLSVGATP